jgi:hypothetical protein
MEPTMPQWEVTVKRRNAVPVAEVEDPPRISSDPSAPKWAPVANRPSILTRLSGYKAENHLPESEEDITARIIQATTDLLNEPSDDEQVLMPEETTEVPASTMSEGWEPTVPTWEVPDVDLLLEPAESIDMQHGDGQYIDEEDLLSGYVSGDDDPDWETPDFEYVVMETEGPQAAQSGVIYPASNS